MLELKNVSAFYGNIQALFGINLTVNQGEIVTLVGANGAGKSTTLKSITRLVKKTTGEIMFMGKDLSRLSTEEVVSQGIALVPEGRRIFPGLTVYENLELGACSWRKGNAPLDADLDRVYELFPRLKERHSQLGWSLSGGEAQMLAIGRGLMARPKLLLLDEPSLGLSPVLVEQVFEALVNINRQGTTLLLVEQNAHMALSIAHRGYVLENGHIALEGAASDLAAQEEVQRAYLGG
ncbi:MAG: ABC transporter ATP-binding protein [Clostridia bacterium]|nr:ABC transporter ATP-binding protein [Clostridia bacterium]